MLAALIVGIPRVRQEQGNVARPRLRGQRNRTQEQGDENGLAHMRKSLPGACDNTVSSRGGLGGPRAVPCTRSEAAPLMFPIVSVFVRNCLWHDPPGFQQGLERLVRLR